MRKLIALATTAVFAATAAMPALAEAARQEAPLAASTPTTDPQADTKRYCVTDSMVGSRLPKKICKTRAQWIADDNFDPLAPQR